MILCIVFDALGTEPTAMPNATPRPVKKTSESPAKQQPGKVFNEVLNKAPTQSLALHISLHDQRVYLLVGGKVALDSPISSGRRSGWTPKGEFVILEKDLNHRSSLYGDFVDSTGAVVRSGICSKVNAVPSGAVFRGASMKYFMRLTPQGVGMHAGFLPGYPASHGCIRLPLEMAQRIYNTAPLQTPVSITD